MLVASEAEQTFDNNIEGGLKVFCPTDQVFKDFMPKYKNLTMDGKNLLLLYHGIPVYHSMEMLRSNNGVVNTLAIDGANKYDSTIQNDARVGKIGEDCDNQDNEDVAKPASSSNLHDLQSVVTQRVIQSFANASSNTGAYGC
uniref:Fasciclin-like arabinogalactan protein 2 n=1 Tax=Nelumbo nucifera TaxID=4432 RepID=A0A822XK99_NELNU|nr:TPA_asm: hypothetical protein HUJ06_021606 [Nelumbo nucifera]